MSLNSVSAVLSTSGSKTTLSLVHKETAEVVQTLELTKAAPTHRNFILSTWLKSYRPQARKDGIQEYYNTYEPAIAESRWQDCHVLSDESGFTVYAWVCAYRPVSGSTQRSAVPGQLYHVYVIPELRHIGVARRLIEAIAGDGDITYARPWPGRPKSYRVNPYLLTVKTDAERTQSREAEALVNHADQ